MKNLKLNLLHVVFVFILAACGGGESANVPTGSPPPNEPQGQGTFDLGMIRDSNSANCTFSNERLNNDETATIWDVSYQSWEYINETGLQEITIRGFAAKPAGENSNLPAVVMAHGLGGFAEQASADWLARHLNAFVIVYSGPGAGDTNELASQSEGVPHDFDSGYRLFDVLEDPRGSWFWGHAVAGMRGLTCLAARPEVDAANMGMTGGSAGAIATLIASSVDDRIKAAVPLSGTLAFDTAVQATNSWFLEVLRLAGLETTDQEWQILLENFGSESAVLPQNSSAVFMFNGSADEYFTMPAHVATYNAIPGTNKRTSFAANYDHGCNARDGINATETPEVISTRAAIRINGAQKAWFGHWFGHRPEYSVIPSTPTFSIGIGSVSGTVASVTVDTSAEALSVEDVRLWWSTNEGMTYEFLPMTPLGNGNYQIDALLYDFSLIDIAYVDVRYVVANGTDRFSVSSLPYMRTGFTQVVRDVSCRTN